MFIKKKSHQKKKKKKNTKERKKEKNTRQACPVNQKKRKKKERQATQEKKSVKKSNVGEGAIIHGHFRPKMMPYFSFQFSFHFGEKLFGGLREKTPGFYYLFCFLSIQPNTLQKSFLSHFSSKFSIYLVSLPKKHTLKVILVVGGNFWSFWSFQEVFWWFKMVFC